MHVPFVNGAALVRLAEIGEAFSLRPQYEVTLAPRLTFRAPDGCHA